MRMLVKYTAYIDLEKDGTETDRSHYLAFVSKDDVMEVPFGSLEEMMKQAGQYTLAEFVKSERFLEEIRVYDDYREFFADVDTLVLYGEAIPVDLSGLLAE